VREAVSWDPTSPIGCQLFTVPNNNIQILLQNSISYTAHGQTLPMGASPNLDVVIRKSQGIKPLSVCVHQK
jgi:hypothetical protein